MKYCSKCGNELCDEAVVCTRCGCSVDNSDMTVKSSNSGTKTAAKIFMILTSVFLGIGALVSLFVSWPTAFAYFIPLCWTIPMTVSYFSKTQEGEPVSTGLKVCSLLFVNLIAGICMLCDND